MRLEAFGNTCDDRNGTVLYASYSSTDVNTHGNPVTVKRVITSDYRISFPFIVGVLAHEYGHVMGLPELFDRSHSVGNDPMAANHSAGIGRWGTMAIGANGWNHIVRRGGNSARAVDGPNPLCAWSRIELGWITDSPTATDDRLDTVTGDIDLSIHDINSANGKVYKIEVSTDEYFLVVGVINVDEAGTVALTSAAPQVGTPLTATLSDPDGSITGAVWQWQRRVDDTADWVDISAEVAGASEVAEVSSCTPQRGDVGYQLQATMGYRNNHSPNKCAVSDPTAAVGQPVKELLIDPHSGITMRMYAAS